MQTTQSRIVVMEPQPRWTPELQRQFHGKNVHVRHCVRFSDLRKLADGHTVLVLDFDHAPAESMQFLGQRLGRQRTSNVIALASARTAELEWTTRDLGAVDFVIDIPTGERLAELCRCQWAVDGR